MSASGALSRVSAGVASHACPRALGAMCIERRDMGVENRRDHTQQIITM